MIEECASCKSFKQLFISSFHVFFSDCKGVLVDGSCYFLGKQQYDYDTSKLDCRKDGAQLATISSIKTYMAVHEYMLHADHITDRSGLFAWTDLANEVSEKLS